LKDLISKIPISGKTQLLANLAPVGGCALLLAVVGRHFIAARFGHNLALLFGLLMADLPRNVLARSLWDSLRHLLALLLGHILADLLRDSAALLTGDLDADLLGHPFGNISALLLWDLLALLARNILADFSRYVVALLLWHLDGNFAANVLNDIYREKEIIIILKTAIKFNSF